MSKSTFDQYTAACAPIGHDAARGLCLSALAALLLMAVGGGTAQASAPCNIPPSAGGGVAGVSPGPTGPPNALHLGWDVGGGQCNGSFAVTIDPLFTGGPIELAFRAEERTAGQVADNGGGDYTVQLGSDTNQPNANRAWWNFQPSIAYGTPGGGASIDNLDSLTLRIVTDFGNTVPTSPVDLLAIRNAGPAIDDRTTGTNGTATYEDVYQASQNPLFGWLDDCNVDADCTVGTCTNPFGSGMCLQEEGAWKFTLAAEEGDDAAEVSICIHTPGAACFCGPRFVATTGSDTTNCSNSLAPCLTVQHAVDAACSGDIVNVAAGTYPEQVVIGKPLTVQGAGKTNTIIAPTAVVANTTSLTTAAPIAAIVLVRNATGVAINDLKVDGAPAAFSACSPGYVGFFYRNASGILDTVHSANIFLPSAPGCQSLIGVLAQSGGAGSTNLTVQDSMIDNYGKNGITCIKAATTCTITGNKVDGRGPVGLGDAAQNGVQLSDGAQGSIVNNDISGNYYTPQTYCATGVLVFDSDDVTVQGNVIDGNLCDFLAITDNSTIADNVIDPALDYPFSLIGNGNSVTGNIVNGSPSLGVYNDGMNNIYSCNRVSNNAGGGFFFDSSFAGGTGSGAGTPNLLQQNSITGNGVGVDASAIDPADPDINATLNWWGCVAGPGNAGCDSVTANVDASAPAASPPACVACTSDSDCDDGVACNGAETCNLGTAMCVPPVACPICGNGIVEPLGGETCDPPGSAQPPNGNNCQPSCTFCGDGITQAPESCDDGNSDECDPIHPQKPVFGDSCNNNCAGLICKDPSTIKLTSGLDVFKAHGVLVPIDAGLIDFNGNVVAVGLRTAQGTIFEATVPAGAIEAKGKGFKYRNDGARTTGGIYKLAAVGTHDGTYKVTVISYGEIVGAEPTMTTYFAVGGQEWTVHASWRQRGSGWKFVEPIQ
jgi:hypothetical protein